ncbi:MAG TPA: Obg family GTPase CgtA, partial [Pseudogracilibacillus sp.]|nr:Obg family GTPase CgtA [Pseudogracilibacillus sp.]
DENLQSFKDQLKDDSEIFPISALTRDGLRQLLFAIADKLDEIPKEALVDEDVVEITHKEKKAPFIISRADDGAFIISGEEVERMFTMTDFSTEEGAQRFARQLRRLGVDNALRDRGAIDGSVVRILDFEFDFID